MHWITVHMRRQRTRTDHRRLHPRHEGSCAQVKRFMPWMQSTTWLSVLSVIVFPACVMSAGYRTITTCTGSRLFSHARRSVLGASWPIVRLPATNDADSMGVMRDLMVQLATSAVWVLWEASGVSFVNPLRDARVAKLNSQHVYLPLNQAFNNQQATTAQVSTMTAPTANGRSSSRFSLRSSTKNNKRVSHKGVRFWFSSSSKEKVDEDDLTADADAAAREVDAEFAKTKQRTESGGSYVPRVEYGSPRSDVEERDAPWKSNEQVEAHYASLGWAVVSIAKDGNCLFRAISDQLYTNELFHQDIRRRIVDFIEREQQLFRPFVEDEELSDYCTRMRKDGEWGGHLELYAAARLFNIHIVVHTGPVRRLRVTNDDGGDSTKQSPPPPPPYRILQLLFKDDHYSSLHTNEPVQIIEPATTTTESTIDDTTDKRARSPTKAYDSPDKKFVKVQEPPSKCVSIKNLPKKSYKAQHPNRKTVKFQEVIEARPPPREEGKTLLYQEEELPECGVYLPKQVLFKRGKRRVSGATLFSLVHVPSSSNLSPVAESPSTSESSTSSKCSTSTECSSEEHDNQSEKKAPLPARPKPKAPTLRAVPVEFPSKTTFHKGRATAAVCY